MTREEAINRNLCLLEYMKINNRFHPDTPFDDDNFVALEMAIKALEQEPNTDCISRQYLIKKAVCWDKHFADGIRYVALTDILNAPSVNPNLQMLCKFCVENGQPLPCPCDYYRLLKRMEVQE